MVALVDFRCWAKILERMTEWKGVSGVLPDTCLFSLFIPQAITDGSALNSYRLWDIGKDRFAVSIMGQTGPFDRN